MKKYLADKVAIVTGSSKGIGYSIAKSLGILGAKVVINSRDEGRAATAAQSLTDLGIDAYGIAANVDKSEEADELIKKTIDKLGNVHILVNNAGVTRDKLFLRMGEEDWDTVMDVNLKGPFNCVKSAIRPMMKNKWGRIINISSIVGLTGNVGQANYSAAKAGLIGFSKSLAKEFGSRNITVNVIAPGFIETEMTDVLDERIKQEMLNRIPLQRFGDSVEVATLVAFLATDFAAYITGQVLIVDGGLAL